VRAAKEAFVDAGLLVVRVGFGLGMVWFHGWPKLAGGSARWRGVGGALDHFGIGFAHEWWGLLAALAEALGGLLLALGLFTRPAAAALVCVMIVATTQHFVTGVGTPAHALKNAFLFAGLILTGAGRYSLDAWLAARRSAGGRG
jgi:putative oxidoreductase